jgi:hypothetical protein
MARPSPQSHAPPQPIISILRQPPTTEEDDSLAKPVSKIKPPPECSRELVVQNGLKAIIYRLDHPKVATISKKCATAFSQELNEKVQLRQENYWAAKIEVHNEPVYFVYFRWIRSKKFGYYLQHELEKRLESTLERSWKIVYLGRVCISRDKTGVLLRNAIFNKHPPSIEALMT